MRSNSLAKDRRTLYSNSMEQEFTKKSVKKLFIWFVVSFFVLLLFRLIYSYIVFQEIPQGTATGNSYNHPQQQTDYSFELTRKNYASEKKLTGGLDGPQKFDQKYEKVGSISSKSSEFDKDEKLLRDTIKNFKAVIQYEENAGLPGSKTLKLGIGVIPDKFDEMVAEVRKIGVIQAIQINKTDKTNEYKDLNAQKASLEKAIQSLKALKGNKGGRIDELINLENKILEIEETIQKMGVRLGEYDEENEFCTIKFSLSETRLILKGGFFTQFLQRFKASLEWTLKYFTLLQFMVFFMSTGALFTIKVLEKLKSFLK